MSEDSNDANEQGYDLSNVKHLFFYRTHLTGKEYLLLIFKTDQVCKHTMSFEEYGQKSNSLFGAWKLCFSDATCFEYPRWAAKKERAIYKMLGGSLSLLGLFLIITAAMNRHNLMTSPLFLFVIVMIVIFSSAFFYFSSLKRYYDIYLTGDELVVKNSKGERKYNADDISFCRIKRVTGNSLGFKDGVRIEKLERSSYWPALHDYLTRKAGLTK